MMKYFVFVFIWSVGGIVYGQAKKAIKETVEITYTSPENDSTTLLVDCMYYPKVRKVYMDSVNNQIVTFVSDLTFGSRQLSVKVPTKSFVTEALVSFRDQNMEFSEDEYFNLWYLDASSIITEHKGYITLHLMEYNYTGGAHPNSSVEFYHMTKKMEIAFY